MTRSKRVLWVLFWLVLQLATGCYAESKVTPVSSTPTQTVASTNVSSSTEAAKTKTVEYEIDVATSQADEISTSTSTSTPTTTPTVTPTPTPATATPKPMPTTAPTFTPAATLQILSFAAEPDPVTRGGMVTLAWDVPGAASVGITRLSEDGDIFLATEALDLPATGSIALRVPEDYVESVKYHLGAHDVNGVLYHAYVTVGIICQYEKHIAPRCPLTQARVWAASQPFERGTMIWRDDTDEIYVLHDDDSYESYEDTWQEGDPVNVPDSPPSGLFAPVRGFGHLYANQPHLPEKLGWATAPEAGYTMTVETIPGGSGRYPGTSTFFTLPDNHVIALYPFSSTWSFFP